MMCLGGSVGNTRAYGGNGYWWLWIVILMTVVVMVVVIAVTKLMDVGSEIGDYGGSASLLI